MKKNGEIKVCLVGSSGGHLTHLYMLKSFWKDKNRFWVTFDKEDARSLLEGEKVYIRGTDYVKLKPSGEYVQPSVDQMKCKIHEFENKYNAPIFLVTEDGDIFDNLKKEFGDIIRIVSFDTFIRNYEGKDVLSKSDVLEKDKKLRGQKYLAKMILLAKCKYFVGSMTQGSKFSYILNA